MKQPQNLHSQATPPALAQGLGHRIASAILVCVIPMAQAGIGYADDPNPWRLLGMLGWLVVAWAWFLRPAVFVADCKQSVRRSAALACISKARFIALVLLGALIAVCATVLHTAT